VNEAQTFGRYKIIRKLGRGMADVYLARDSAIDNQVILKTIEISEDESARLAVEAERRGAHIQRQLSSEHENILDIYESGEQDGRFFVAMEYFPGRTMAEILQAEGPLAPKRAARYAAEICQQLTILHEFVPRGKSQKSAVVHGDIKPSNIQIGADGELRILDFGIAKFISSGHDLTRHQLGSPSYCSPERLRDSQVNVHADLWALGISLYEMLAGSPPFQAQNTRRLEALIQSGKPPVPLPDEVPADLKAIVARALATNIDCRYPSAEAMGKDLLAFIEDRPIERPQENSQPADAKATVLRQPKPPVASGVHQIDALKDAVHGKRPQILVKPAVRDLPNVAIALLSGILAGLILFIPATQYFQFREISRSLNQRKDYVLLPASVLAGDWQRYQTSKRRGSWWNQLFPSDEMEESFRANLIDSANNLVGRFRRSPSYQMAASKWSRARLCLLYALEIDPRSERARGQLHLCDGYLSLDSGAPGVYGGLRAFHQAEALLPRSPDPHLGLARGYITGVHNIGAGLAELHQAEQLGYKLGPREMELEGDGYLFRAEAELSRAQHAGSDDQETATKWLHLSSRDFERAQNLYEPIAGFDRVDGDLEQLYGDQSEQAKLETAVYNPPHPKAHAIFLKIGFAKKTGSRRWR